MVRVEEAEKIIQSRVRFFGTEHIGFELAMGRVLAEEIKADRDLPPYDRVTMDGIAISYEAFQTGIRSFRIKATQAAGDEPVNITAPGECIEIMTGAALPPSTDTVIRYEDLELNDGTASVAIGSIIKGQSIHYKGKDKKQHQIVAKANQVITPAVVSLAASIGATELLVTKLPRVVIISTGDELVDVNVTPLPYQVRRSNNYTIKAVLNQYGLMADMLHIPDDAEITKQKVKDSLHHYDAIIFTGGISMGKFDFVPKALEALSVENLFYQVQQRPGKPFWFGEHVNGVLVFAFPGNPVSTFMCLHRYFLPWLEASSGIRSKPNLYAVLDQDFSFKPPLQYFLQVSLQINEMGQLLATPAEGNGSGDFSNLVETQAFLELPLAQDNFGKGEVFRVWPFKGRL